MNKRFTDTALLFLTFLSFILLQDSCIPTEKVNPNLPPKDSTIVINPIVAKWDTLNSVSAEQLIRAIHATPFELFFLTNNQFFRLDTALSLKEVRILSTDRPLFGSPVFSDNVFMRISQALNNRQVIELHLTKNSNNVQRISTDALVDTVKKQSLKITTTGRTPGCFTADGTKLLIAAELYPDFQPVVAILDIKLNFQADNFQSVTLAKLVKVPNLSTEDRIESCRFIKGNFYLATKDGGFRVNTEGVVTRLFTTWAKDFFEKDNKIYATGFNGGDFSVSTDNGATWKKMPGGSELQYVEVANGQVFSQIQRGLIYNLADSALAKVKQINYNAGFPINKFDIYSDVKYFNKKYYFNAGDKGNRVLATDKVLVK